MEIRAAKLLFSHIFATKQAANIICSEEQSSILFSSSNIFHYLFNPLNNFDFECAIILIIKPKWKTFFAFLRYRIVFGFIRLFFGIFRSHATWRFKSSTCHSRQKEWSSNKTIKLLAWLWKSREQGDEMITSPSGTTYERNNLIKHVWYLLWLNTQHLFKSV